MCLKFTRYCILFSIAMLCISRTVSAQKNISFRHCDELIGCLCAESIICYNDSVAFYDYGCENHTHHISILKYKKQGDTLSFITIKDGFKQVINKIEKKRGIPNHPKIKIIGLHNKSSSHDLLYVLEEPSIVLREFDLKNKTDSFFKYKRQISKMSITADNIFPLLYDEVKIYPQSSYNEITVYLNLPLLCLQSVEARVWTEIDIKLIETKDCTYSEIGNKAKWEFKYYN